MIKNIYIMNVKHLEFYERQKTQLHTKLHVQRSLVLNLHKVKNKERKYTACLTYMPRQKIPQTHKAIKIGNLEGSSFYSR